MTSKQTGSGQRQTAAGNHPESRKRQAGTVSVAIFASGAGTNAQKIIGYFKNHPIINITLIVCNKPGAGVLRIAAQEHIPTLLLDKGKFSAGNGYLPELQEKGIDFIVLAGFLWKLPPVLVHAYPGRIINIHPALLPAYGGAGKYGRHVHEAVIAAKDKESGISIHYVDELYDHGHIIIQVRCPVGPEETSDSLALKIHALEHEYYPRIIEKVIIELQNRR